MKNSFLGLYCSLLLTLLLSCSNNSTVHEHTYEETWTYNEYYHWHKATCGHDEKGNKERHKFNDVVFPATYEEPGYTTHTCVTCGYSYVDSQTDQLIHNYSDSWSNDESYHWHACIDLGYESLTIDEESHIFVDYVTPATYDHSGYTTHTCSTCGYSYVDSETDQLIHSYSEEWSHNATKHWHSCTDSGYEDLKADVDSHLFSEVITPPTYEHAGFTTHTCDICGYSYVDGETDQLIHNYSDAWAFNETNHWHSCTDQGYEDLKSDDEIHDFKDVVTPPTYENGGYTSHTCMTCGYSFIDSRTDKLEHHYSDTWSYNKTNHWRSCTDEGYEDLKILDGSHSFSEVISPPTYEHGGYTTHTCDICGYSYFDGETDKLEHHYSDTWSYDDTDHWHACTDKGYEDLSVDIEGHKMSVSTVLATEDSEGYTIHSCECGYSYKDNYTSALNKFVYQLNSEKTGYGIYGYIGEAEYLTIPSTYNSLPVVSIGYKGFLDNTKIKSLVLPDSITSIGVYAFSGCISLESIILSKNISEIRDYTFKDCSSLKELTIPDSVLEMSSNCLLGCVSIKKILLSDNLIYIPSGLLKDLGRLEYLETPYVGGKNAGEGFLSFLFGSTKYQDNSEYIPESLSKVVITSASSIEHFAFSNCSSLKNVEINEGILNIGEGAFEFCSSLISIKIPDSVKSIGYSTFAGCSSLASITIPFVGKSCEEIYFSPETCFGYIFGNKNFNNSIRINQSRVGYDYLYSFPMSLEKVEVTGAPILRNAFWGCSFLKTIILSGEMTRIESGTFFECSSLTNFSMPDSISYIGDSAFEGCLNLSSINIPKYATFIGESAFKNCESIDEIKLPNGITSIEEYCFYNCKKLKQIIIPETVTWIKDHAFDNCSLLEFVQLPSSLKILSGFNCCGSLDSISIPDSVAHIGEGCFYQTSLSSINLPRNLNYIGRSAFAYCSKLESVNFCSGPYCIETYAFLECSNLKQIFIPQGTEIMHNGVFGSCTSLETVELPSTLQRLGDGVFGNCISLKEILIPDSVTIFKERNFKECKKLLKVTLGNGLNSIPEETFSWCTSLKEISISDGVSTIATKAFEKCTSLKQIVIPSSVSLIEKSAFENCSSSLNVYYCGLPSNISVYDESIQNSFYYYSEQEPSDANNNYWHYVEGVPTIW